METSSESGKVRKESEKRIADDKKAADKEIVKAEKKA